LDRAEILPAILLDDLAREVRQLSQIVLGNQSQQQRVQANDTLVADGTEQTVVSVSSAAPFELQGWFKLLAEQAGDRVIIRVYCKLLPADDCDPYAVEQYEGPVSPPLVKIGPLPGMYGTKITLQQIAGTMRKYPYQFFRKG